MVGIVLALFSAIFIAFSQIALRKSYKDLKPSVAFFFDSIFGLIIWVPLALIMGVNLGIGLKEAFIFATISAILSEAIVFYALSHGELAVTATILATYPVYTVFFSRVINQEILTPALLLFVMLAIAGSVGASLPDKVNNNGLKINKAIVWPFIAAISIGLSDTISKGYINRSGDFSLLFMLGFVQVPVALSYLRLEKQNLKRVISGTIIKIGDFRQALIGGLFNIIGTGFLWLSFSYAPASIASPITGANGVLTIMLAHIILKDRLSVQKYLTIAVAFIGVIGVIVLRAN